jgi:hypothetical protein
MWDFTKRQMRVELDKSGQNRCVPKVDPNIGLALQRLARSNSDDFGPADQNRRIISQLRAVEDSRGGNQHARAIDGAGRFLVSAFGACGAPIREAAEKRKQADGGEQRMLPPKRIS